MHKKEKEVLAILGLILSVAFCIASIYYTLNNPITITKSDVQASPVSVKITPVPLSEAEQKLMSDAKIYGDKIVDNLLIKNNYEFIYHTFDKDIKQAFFNNDIQKCKNDLKALFGYLGIASNFVYTNQVLSPNKESITCFYSITYKKDYYEVKTVLQVYLKVNNNTFSLNGMKQTPI